MVVKALFMRIFAVCSILSLLSMQANSDVAQKRSIEEMQAESKVIIDGTVTHISLVETIEDPHPNGQPVVKRKFLATFKIDKALKGLTEAQIASNKIFLHYLDTADPRYRGEKIPSVTVGDSFRVYADATTYDDGYMVAYLHSRNSVRPEAYNLENQTSLNQQSVLVDKSEVRLSKPDATSQLEASSPQPQIQNNLRNMHVKKDLHTRHMSWGLGMFALCIAIITAVLFVFRSKIALSRRSKNEKTNG